MQITRYFTCPIWTTGEPKLWRTSHYSTTRSCCSRLAFNESSLTDIFQPKEYSNELPQCCVKPAPIAFCICGLCLVVASAIWLISGGYNKLRACRHDTQPCMCSQTCRKTPTVVSEDIHITIKTHLDNLLHQIKLFGCAPSALLMFESPSTQASTLRTAWQIMCAASHMFGDLWSRRVLVSQTLLLLLLHTFCLQPHKKRATEEKRMQQRGIIKFVFSELWRRKKEQIEVRQNSMSELICTGGMKHGGENNKQNRKERNSKDGWKEIFSNFFPGFPFSVYARCRREANLAFYFPQKQSINLPTGSLWTSSLSHPSAGHS